MKSKDQITISVNVREPLHSEWKLEARRLNISLADFMRIAASEKMDRLKTADSRG